MSIQIAPAPLSLTPAWNLDPVSIPLSGYGPLANIDGPAPTYVPPQLSLNDPRIDGTVRYPVTCGDLNARIVTGGRIEPNIKTRRQKVPQLLVRTGERFTDPAMNPYFQQTLRTSYRLPDGLIDTRRLNPEMYMPTYSPGN